MPVSRRTLMLAAVLAPPARAAAQPATPTDLDAAMDDHVAWVVSLFDGAAADLTVAEVETRFDATFLDVVPPREFVATVRQLAAQLGPLELIEEHPAERGEFIGIFRAESGATVMISIALNPSSGRIAGFFITPVDQPAATPAASPIASPVAAAPVVDDPASQVARYTEAVAAIRTVGEPVVAAVLAGDDAALAPSLSPDVATALGSTPIASVVDAYTARQLQMTFAEVGAHFFGQWNDTEIAGVMVQSGAPFPFTLTAEAAQAEDVPQGVWTGTLTGLGLDLSVTFDVDAAGDLTATLDIPRQGVAGVALINVEYRAEKPIGAMTADRAFAPGGRADSYTAEYAWGDAHIWVAAGIDLDTDQVTGLQVVPSVPLAPDPDAPQPTGTYRLPFDGTWWVFWGGTTELQNYHAAVASQRHAYDLVIWKDGATRRGAADDSADYWAWSQPVLAPVDGEVVVVVDGIDDLPPNSNLGNPQATAQPAGNHVAIRVAETEYVLIAHLQRGSVRVREGDRVRSGDLLGLVGNSGNSSEPHIHIHVQTTPAVLDPTAVGIPLRFDRILVDGVPASDAIPVQGRFIANS